MKEYLILQKGYHKVAAKYHGKITDRDYGIADKPGTPISTQRKKVKSASKHLRAYEKHIKAGK